MDTNNNGTEHTAIKVEGERNVAVGGDIDGSVIIGDHNTINTKIVTRNPEQERADRNRRAMLEVVLEDWVKGLLEKPLYYETRIDLGLEERPGAVTRPWDAQVQMPDQPNRALPPGTPIVQVFDEAQGELLILGAPGAGKTTVLLELARDTIARARQDASLPIPVVFNLSSWSDPKQPLAAWLVAELINKYHTPKKVAQGWVDQDELLLLLDGLDEVRDEYREACAQAINAFRQAHGLTMPLVVCSRIADYEALTTRLQLRSAVLLQPLTDQQIGAYFAHAGHELAGVRHAWQQDAELQELARQPLMLNIMTLAYRGIAPEALVNEQAGSLGARRKHLFDAYIRQMFARMGRAKDERYTPEQTIRWLAWLAQKMIEQGQSVFLLENMRRSWLPGAQQRLHKIMVVVMVGLVFGIVFGLMDRSAVGMIFGIALGLAFGRVFGLVEVPKELLKWSWRKAWVGPLAGLVFGLLFGLIGGLMGGLMVGLMFGLMLGSMGGLMFGLLAGLEGAEMETKIKTVPNQGIQRSLKNGLTIGLMGGLLVELMLGLMFGLILGLTLGLMFGLMLGLMFGLMLGLMFGLSAAINHYSLRLLLYRNGHIPGNYEHFLDYAVEHLFLRQVGGSYVFVHRSLMEHFAMLGPNQATPKK